MREFVFHKIPYVVRHPAAPKRPEFALPKGGVVVFTVSKNGLVYF